MDMTKIIEKKIKALATLVISGNKKIEEVEADLQEAVKAEIETRYKAV